MKDSKKLVEKSLWCVFMFFLCACLALSIPINVSNETGSVEAIDAVRTESELISSISAEEVEAAVFAIYLNQVKRDLVGSLEVKISENFQVPPTEANEFARWIVYSAEKYGVDEILLTSIVATESSFRKDAVSHKGAVGLAQIMPRYWEDFCSPLDLSVPRDNIECGARILSHLLELCSDESCAIKSYNMGFSRVKAGKKFPSVEHYERTVEQFKEVFAFNF